MNFIDRSVPVEKLVIGQSQIHYLQEELIEKYETTQPLEEHYFADGVYARVMKVPSDTWVIGKAHKTEHISIMLKGKALVTMDDGSVVPLEAPAIFVTPAGKKKMAYVEEEMWFVNIHPTETRDLDVIESSVIMTDEEHKLFLNAQKSVDKIEDSTPVTIGQGE